LSICLVDSQGGNSQVFPYEVKARLTSIAEECGVGVKISHVEQTLTGDALLVQKGLYGYKKINGERDGRMSVVACSDISQEIKSVAREINHSIRNGARYKDVAIVCCDFENYAPYIKSVFDNFGIPFYADIKQPLSTQSISKLIGCAIRAVTEDFARPEVVEYAKHPFITSDYREACIFENYCLKYGIEYTRFLSPFTIGDESAREVAEKVRQRVVATLTSIDNSEKSVIAFVDSIENFLKECDAENQIERLAERQSLEGYEELSSITLQSARKIQSLLSQCKAMLGESMMSLDEFYSILSTAIDSVEMSNIPLYSDCVFIGECSESRYENIDYMYVIGATAGKFPLEHNDTGIVSEREYVAWGKLGIDVQPDCRRRNSKERLNTLMMLTRARKRLRISYSASGSGGEMTQPSSTVQYLCDLLDITPQLADTPNREWDKQDFAKYVSSKGNVMQELLSLNSLIKNGGLESNEVALQVEDILYSLACEEKGKEYVDSMLDGLKEEIIIDGASDVMFNGNHTSVSQFEKYFKCPFLHFNENVLKLQNREISGLEVKDTGILLHATLERYFRLSDCAEKSEEEIEKVVTQLFLEAVEDNEDYK
ncbi:MAG: PD-(D/E)XK nuclease family protein, partial [Clostridia bacterium]|nr:PD-(D/E)XK nuclease family protein [Clostridia bacterium]